MRQSLYLRPQSSIPFVNQFPKKGKLTWNVQLRNYTSTA
nr:MAG TPA: hypothetical protein [Caudoviricetes sp.]